jgi:Zn-finger protein
MSYKFFQNKECEYFPCHKKGVTNCVFCYCPLYLYDQCGGHYKILKNGIKDCSNCNLPHSEMGYDYIVGFLKDNIKGSNVQI